MRWFANFMLLMSLMLMIAGTGMAFSRSERERIQKMVTQELPERAALLDSPEALRKAKRRGYITLAVGLTLLGTWFFVFGKLFV